MPELENKKHEKFAQLVVAGNSQTDAARLAGLPSSKATASAIKNRPEVSARIEELRPDRTPVVVPLTPDSRAPAGSLAAMGYSPTWFADAYRDLSDRAKKAGQFAAATTALTKVQALYEDETKGQDAAPRTSAAHIDIHQLGGILDKVAGVIAASKAPDQSGTANAVTPAPEMRAMRALENAESEE